MTTFIKLLNILFGLMLCASLSTSQLSPPPPKTDEKPLNQTSVYYRCVQSGTTALTFDDGPHENKTKDVLDVLRYLNVPAAFFVVGKKLNWSDNKNLLKRTFSEGHCVGSHSWNHNHLTTLDEIAIVSEMNWLSDAVYAIINRRPIVMRPPYGNFNNKVKNIIYRQLGYRIIMWSIATNDWAHPGDTEAGIRGYAKVLEGTNPILTPGFIALHHDPEDGSAELASTAIKYARMLGYRYVSLAECLGIPL